MKKPKYYLILTLGLVAVIFLLIKYYTYLKLISVDSRLLFSDSKLEGYYAKHLAFPNCEKEFEDYLLKEGDTEFIELIHSVNYHLLYDSLNERISLYSNGMDWDDDQMIKVDTPRESRTFFKSLFVDGDPLWGCFSPDVNSDLLTSRSYTIITEDSKLSTAFRNKIRLEIECAIEKILRSDLIKYKDRELPDDEAKQFILIRLFKIGNQIKIKIAEPNNDITLIRKIENEIHNNVVDDLSNYDMVRILLSTNIYLRPALTVDCEQL